MSRGYDPDAHIDAKSAAWLRATGLFGDVQATALRRKTRGELWKQWIEQGCELPTELSEAHGFAVYRRLKPLLASGDAPHPVAILKRAAMALGKKPATRSNLNDLIGRVMVSQVETIHKFQGLQPRKRVRAVREGTLEEALDILPPERRSALDECFRRAAARGTPIPAAHLGRVLDLHRELQPVGAMILLSCSWEKKSPATFQSYLMGVEAVDDLLLSVRPIRLHKLLARADVQASSFSEKQLVALRTFSVAVGAARKFVIERFGSRAAARLFFCLFDPAWMPDIIKAARKVIDGRDRRRGLEREDQVIADLEQNDRIDRLVRQRRELTELIFNRYVDALKELGGADPEPGYGFIVETPVFDEDGHIIGANQRIHFRLDTAGNVARRAHERNREGPMHHTMATLIARLDVFDPSSELRENLVVLYDKVTPVVPGGPTSEPFFVGLYRWGVMEGTTRQRPFISACRKELMTDAGFSELWEPIPDILNFPTPLRSVARAARGDDPRDGEIAIPVVALYHGALLGSLSHVVARAACPRTYELLQIQLGREFIGKELLSRKKHYPLKMRPKAHFGLHTYEVPFEALHLIHKIVNLCWQRWYPELRGKVLTLPVRPCGLSGSKPLPDGQYVFTNSTRTLTKEELLVVRHFILWDVSSSKIHDQRFVLATKFGLAGSEHPKTARLLKQRPRSKQPRHYDRSGGILSRSEAKKHSNRRGRDS